MLSARFSGRLETYADGNAFYGRQDTLRPTIFDRADVSIQLHHYLGFTGDQSIIAFPGQQISGTITYSTKDQQDVESIAVTLKGKCARTVTGPEGVVEFYEKTKLFRVRELLFQGPSTIQQNTTYVWPFVLTVPDATQLELERQPGHVNHRFVDKPHALPPTMDVTFSDRELVKIYYTLKVKAVPHPRTFRTHEKAIVVVLPPLETPSADKAASIRLRMPGAQQWASAALRTQQPTMREKFNSVLTGIPIQLPSLAYVVHLHMPMAATVWQRIPIAISVQLLKKSTAEHSRCKMVLQSLEFDLKSVTDLRSERGQSEDDVNIEADLECLPLLLARKFIPLDGTSVLVSEKLRLADLAPESKKLLPSLTTYTVSRRYMLGVRGVIEHVDTGHAFTFKTKLKEPFVILAPQSEPGQDRKTVGIKSEAILSPKSANVRPDKKRKVKLQPYFDPGKK